MNTPFCQPPLVNVLGSLIDEENTTAIFDSTFDPPLGIPEDDYKLIDVIKIPDSIWQLNELNFDLTPEENAAVWQKINEPKGSVKTSLSLSHHKAWAMDDFLNPIDTFLCSFPLKIVFSQGIGSLSLMLKSLRK